MLHPRSWLGEPLIVRRVWHRRAANASGETSWVGVVDQSKLLFTPLRDYFVWYVYTGIRNILF